MISICLGIPTYGSQKAAWWQPLITEAANLYKYGIQIDQAIGRGGMMTDVARNHIADEFLKTNSEWLFWIDDDNPITAGTIHRLLESHKTIVTGVYVKRDKKAEPLLYLKLPNNTYQVLTDYRRGEILPIDAAGMGCCLVHRSVFEDIQNNYRVLGRRSGGIMTVNKDSIKGDIFKDASDDTDGQVIDGVYHERLFIIDRETKFPFFMLEYGRTEDYGFYEKAAAMGHKLWADTSVEAGHIGDRVYTPADHREEKQRGR